MDMDPVNAGFGVACVENCQPAPPEPDAPIVNVDANFLIHPSEQGTDGAFPRLRQMHAMFVAAEKAGSLVDASSVPLELRLTRPYRPPDYAEEWKLLRKAWSLIRNDKAKLARQKIAAASDEFYRNDPLNNLQDWLWRFAMFVCQPSYEQPFRDIMKAVKPLQRSTLCPDFSKACEATSEERGSRYFSVMKEFYSAHSEFSQTYFFVTKGVPLPVDHQTTSTDFEAVRMFYGNTYEQFTSLIEYLAMLNNMLLGRPYDTFDKLTLKQYRKLDKSSRFGPFSLNGAFMAICSEAENQIRNASHHGSFVFRQEDQTIRYHAGKGGSGPEQKMSYVNYLERCVRIFLQTMTLLRVEIIIATQLNVRPPL
jgi:hypothetical protein